MKFRKIKTFFLSSLILLTSQNLAFAQTNDSSLDDILSATHKFDQKSLAFLILRGHLYQKKLGEQKSLLMELNNGNPLTGGYSKAENIELQGTYPEATLVFEEYSLLMALHQVLGLPPVYHMIIARLAVIEFDNRHKIRQEKVEQKFKELQELAKGNLAFKNELESIRNKIKQYKENAKNNALKTLADENGFDFDEIVQYMEIDPEVYKEQYEELYLSSLSNNPDYEKSKERKKELKIQLKSGKNLNADELLVSKVKSIQLEMEKEFNPSFFNRMKNFIGDKEKARFIIYKFTKRFFPNLKEESAIENFHSYMQNPTRNKFKLDIGTVDEFLDQTIKTAMKKTHEEIDQEVPQDFPQTGLLIKSHNDLLQKIHLESIENLPSLQLSDLEKLLIDMERRLKLKIPSTPSQFKSDVITFQNTVLKRKDLPYDKFAYAEIDSGCKVKNSEKDLAYFEKLVENLSTMFMSHGIQLEKPEEALTKLSFAKAKEKFWLLVDPNHEYNGEERDMILTMAPEMYPLQYKESGLEESSSKLSVNHSSPQEIKTCTRWRSGIANHGNTCYLNSMVQVLANTSGLDEIFKDSNKINKSFSEILRRNFKVVIEGLQNKKSFNQSNGPGALAIKNFLNSVDLSSPDFKTRQFLMQDPEEFLIALNNSLNLVSLKNEQGTNIFGFQIQNTKRKKLLNSEPEGQAIISTDVAEMFMGLGFPVESSDHTLKKEYNFTELFKNYMNDYIADFKNDDGTFGLLQQKTLVKAPENLMFKIQRQQNVFNPKTKNVEVVYNNTSIIAQESLKVPTLEGEKEYELSSIIFFRGLHYMSYVKNKDDGKWYFFNDGNEPVEKTWEEVVKETKKGSTFYSFKLNK